MAPPAPRDLVASHYAAVWSLARKLTRDDATASDITQETFARALQHIEADAVHSPASWLFKIATNLVRDLHRRQSRPEPPAKDAVVPPCDAILERHEDLARVRRALDALPTESRAAMVLHLQEDLSIPDIAFILDMTEAAVRNRIHRALHQVRAELSEEA